MRFKVFLILSFIIVNNDFSFGFEVVKKIGKAEGLVSNKLSCVFKDSQHYLWIGTSRGISRFDAYEFQTYSHFPFNKNSIPSNNIRSIIELDSTHLLIASFGKGLIRYNRRTHRFTKDSVFHRFGSEINHLSYSKEKGKLWIVTNKNGAFLCDASFAAIREFSSHTVEGLTNQIQKVHEDQQKRCWFLTNKGVYSVQNKKKENNKADLFFENRTTTLMEVVDYQRLLVKADGKLFTIATDKSVTTPFQNIPIQSILKLPSKQYIYSTPSATYAYEGNIEGLSLDASKKITEQTFNFFTQDSEEIIWGGTKEGLFMIGLDTKIKKLYATQESKILSFYQKDEMFYTGTTDFLSIKKGNDIQKLPFTGIHHICESNDETLWFVSKKSLYYKPKGENVRPFSIQLDFPIRSLYYDVEKRLLWLGCAGYVAAIDIDKHTINYQCQLPEINWVSSIVRISKDELWFGTHGGGIISLKKGKLMPQSKIKLSNPYIEMLTKDEQDNVWVATKSGLNIYHIKSKKTFAIYRKNGLIANWIHAVKTYKNTAFVLTNEGVNIINSNNKKVVKTIDLFHANYEDLGFFLEMDIKEKQLLFASTNKIYAYNLLSSTSIETIPKVDISFVKIDNATAMEELNYHHGKVTEIHLTHQDDHIRLSLTDFEYANFSKIHFYYQLGDKEWIPCQKNHISIQNLRYGKHKLKLGIIINDEIQKDSVGVFTIYVHPPFWLTPVAYVLYSILCLVILYLLVRKLMQINRRKQDKKNQQIKLREELKFNNLKTRLFTNLSHEIKTPLTLISGPAKLLKNKLEGDNEEHSKLINLIEKNVTILENIVQEILDYKNIDVEKLSFSPKYQELSEGIKDVIKLFEPLAQEYNLSYESTIDASVTSGLLDQAILEKCLTNLLSNAFKYTPKGGKVTVYAAQKDNDLIIKVIDTGIGIAQDKLIHVFSRTSTAENELKDREKSSGIGLSIVKDLAELHGGEISVESKLNEGSTFTLLLKLEHSKPSIKDGATQAYNIGEDTKADNAKKTLLFVEDNPDIQEYLSTYFSYHYNILHAFDGQDGVNKALAQQPDLVVSDVMMPLKDGYELCREIKQNEQTNHIPVILLTAKGTKEDIIEGLETKADHYLVKPFDIEELALRIENILTSRQMLRNRFSQEIKIEASEVTVTSSDAKLLQLAIDAVEANIDNTDFSVEELASEIGLSKSHLYNKIQAFTGDTAGEFIKSIKLKRAAQLFQSGEDRVNEVTYQVGFSSPRYFATCFKKQFGMSPTDYIKKNGKKM